METKRSFPFWAWNGKVNKNEIEKQIPLFKKMGYGGFIIHPRSGLETEYLSKEWFSLVNYAIKTAKKNGLEVYLYDEDRYPSGTCGGLVTNEPKYQEKHLCVSITDKIVMEEHDSTIAVFTAHFDGEYLVDYKKYADGDNGTFLIFYTVNSSPSTYFNKSPYIDTLSKEATNRFLSLTHEKYKKYCGKEFGKTVKGIFTDEVHYAHTFCNEVTYYNEKKNLKTAYTTDLFERFFEKYGYDLKEKLPELFFRKKGETYRKISWQYINLIEQMFIDNFAKPYNEWCEKNNIKFIGHVLQEDELSSQTSSCGSCMNFYEFMGYPGVDMLREEPNTDWIYKQVSSVSKQLSKPHSLCECYGATGYKVTIERYKKMNDILSFYDIDFRVPHLAPFTLKGRCKRDYPANLSFQTCGYEKLKLIEDYSYNLNTLLRSALSTTEVCVISPIESMWALASANTFRDCCYDAKSEQAKEIDRNYKETFKSLTKHNIDFDYADEITIENYAFVSNKNGIPTFSVGNMDYRIVLLYGNRVIRKSTYSLIKEFASLGGKVIVDENLSLCDFEGIILDDNFVIVSKIENACDKIKNYLINRIDTSNCIATTLKQTDFGYYLFALNTDRHKCVDSEIKINGKYKVTEIDIINNIEKIVKVKEENNSTIICDCFSEGNSKLYKLSQDDSEMLLLDAKEENNRVIELNEFDYELTSDNILLLDNVKYSINGKQVGNDYVLTVDSNLRSKYFLEQKKEMMCQPYYKAKHEKAYGEKLCDLSLSYEFIVDEMPSKISLAIEQSELMTIFINNNKLSKKNSEVWVDSAFKKFDIPTHLLKKGKNEITLQCEYKDFVNVEGIFLVGNFGVEVQDSRIVKLPNKLRIGSIISQGLPYYSDAIIYKTNIKSGKVKVKMQAEQAFSMSVINGEKEYDVSFYPYEKQVEVDGELKIKLYLSRQNTFGAIHNKNDNILWNGPFTFIDVKNGLFTKEHNLQPQGLLQSPIIEIEN